MDGDAGRWKGNPEETEAVSPSQFCGIDSRTEFAVSYMSAIRLQRMPLLHHSVQAQSPFCSPPNLLQIVEYASGSTAPSFLRNRKA